MVAFLLLQVTHQVLLSRNQLGQTFLAMIEVNRENLQESLSLVLKREYGCHHRDMKRTEFCLSKQLESSDSGFHILQELYTMEPKSICEISWIWFLLFLTSLLPNLALGIQDILSDAYLSTEYYNDWKNETHTNKTAEDCNAYLSNIISSNGTNRTELKAFAVCLDSQTKFYYTIGFLLLSLVFYLTEFLVLDLKYEPTGLRKKISVSKMPYDVS
jgi:hypothetical protein